MKTEVRWRACTAAAVCGIILAAAAVAQDFASPFEAEINSTFIGVNAEVEDLLLKVRTQLTNRSYSAAARIVQRIIEREYDGLVEQTVNHYITVHDYCEQLLASGDPDLLVRYRELVDPQAQAIYARRDRPAVIGLARSMALASEGAVYLFEAGSILLEQGQAAAAAGCFERCFRYFPGRIDQAQLLGAGYIAAVAAGREQEAVLWQERIKTFGRPVMLGGRTIPADQFFTAAEILRPRREKIPAAPLPVQITELWRLEIDARTAMVPGSHTLQLFDPVQGRLTAVSLLTGSPVWSREVDLGTGADGLFACGPGRTGVILQHRIPSLLQRYPGAPGAPGRLLIVDNADGTVLHTITVTRPGHKIQYDAHPVCSGGALYFGYQVYPPETGSPEVFVARYDLEGTGVPAWETFICQGLGQEGGELTVMGGTVVYLTNRGVVAGIEAHAGTVEWVFRYPQAPDWLRRGGRGAENAPPAALVRTADTLFVRPADGVELKAFTPEGKILWSVDAPAVHSLFAVDQEIYLHVEDRLDVYTRAQAAPLRSVPLTPGLTIFPAGGWYFLAGPDSLAVQEREGPARPLNGWAGGPVPQDIQVSDTFVLLRGQAAVTACISDDGARYAAGDRRLADLISAETALSAGQWDRGEDLMARFFEAAGERLVHRGVDLVPHARARLDAARRVRADRLFTAGDFEAARTWYIAIQDRVTGADRLAVMHQRAECARKLALWSELTVTAQAIIREFGTADVEGDNGVIVTGREYGAALIRQALAAAGRDIYAVQEEAASVLFGREAYEELVNLYPNSRLYEEALHKLAGVREAAGDIRGSLACFQALAAGRDDAAGLLTEAYRRLGLTGALAEFVPAPEVTAAAPEYLVPLYPAWERRFGPAEIPAAGGPAQLRFLAGDKSGAYCEYRGTLTRLSLAQEGKGWEVKPEYGWLGIGLESSNNPVGIRITKVFENMPAHAHGFRAGDVIVMLDGWQVDGVEGFVSRIKMLKPGTPVVMKYMRAGSLQELTMPLGRRPDEHLYNDIRTAHLGRGRLTVERGYAVECYDAETGKLHWTLNDADSDTTVFGGGTFCQVTGRGIRYGDSVTGTILWEHPAVSGPGWEILLAPARYLAVISRGRDARVHVYDRLFGRHLYSLPAGTFKALTAAAEGLVTVGADGRVACIGYADGAPVWEVKLPFSPAPANRAVFLLDGGEGLIIVWVMHEGGLLIRNGRILAAYNEGDDKRFRIVNFVGQTLVCIRDQSIRLRRADGTDIDLPVDTGTYGFPRFIRPTDNPDVFCAVYGLRKQSYALVVDAAAGRIADVIDLGEDAVDLFAADGRLYVLGMGVLACHAHLDADAAQARFKNLQATATVEAALSGARMALKLQQPDAGCLLLAPYADEGGETGLLVDQALLALRRKAFDAAAARHVIPRNGQLTAVMDSRSVFWRDPQRIEGGQDCTWRGKEDLSAAVTMVYDDTQCTVSFAIADDIHVPAETRDRVFGHDCAVLALEIMGGARSVPGFNTGERAFYTIITGFVGDKPEVDVWKQVHMTLPGIALTAVRKETTTRYSLTIPWKDLNIDGTRPPSFRMALLVRDDDGTGVKGEMSWTPAVNPAESNPSRKLETDYFADITLE